MLAVYTETLETLLKNKNFGEPSQDGSLTECLDLMGKFPNFVFGDNINLSILTMFLEKYDVREIGTETEELFLHFWREKCNELLMKYAPKMQKWLENFDDLFKFTVTLKRKDTETTGTSNQNTYYLNPANSNTQNLKVQDVDKSDGNIEKEKNSERDVLQSVWGKTRADIMEKILDLKNIFNDCLYEYEEIFMGVF